jgi:hypothetical protein
MPGASRNCRFDPSANIDVRAYCELLQKLLTRAHSRDWRHWMEHHREARDFLPRAWA